MASNPRQSTRQQICFSFFMHQKSFNKPFEFQLYIKQIDFIFPCLCIVIDYKNNSSHATRLLRVLYCYIHAVMSSVIYYSTLTRESVIYMTVFVK